MQDASVRKLLRGMGRRVSRACFVLLPVVAARSQWIGRRRSAVPVPGKGLAHRP